MIPITDKEEQELDKGVLHTVKSEFVFNIESRNVICYGEINFHDNSEDFNVIENMNWLSWVCGLGVCVPSDYNYEEHCCYSPMKHYRYYDTSNPAIVAQYFHARLGKTERVCIFKEKRYGRKRTF